MRTRKTDDAVLRLSHADVGWGQTSNNPSPTATRRWQLRLMFVRTNQCRYNIPGTLPNSCPKSRVGQTTCACGAKQHSRTKAISHLVRSRARREILDYRKCRNAGNAERRTRTRNADRQTAQEGFANLGMAYLTVSIPVSRALQQGGIPCFVAAVGLARHPCPPPSLSLPLLRS